MSIRVAIVEDQSAVREGLRDLIQTSPELEVQGAFESMEEAVESIVNMAPDVLLADIGLRGMSGVEGVRRIHRMLPDLPVLMLTVNGDDDFVFAALCAGACGYLLKETEPSRLLESIHEVYRGGAPMSPEIARKVVRMFRGFAPSTDQVLSARQYEILELLAKGHSYKSCAEQLHLSIDTIRFHVRHIYERLHVNSRAEAVWKAFKSPRKL